MSIDTAPLMGDPNSLEQGRKRMKSITTKVLIAVALGAYALSSGSSKVEGQNTGSKQEASQQETVSKLRKAAEQGDAEAQYNLGVRYANGEGVPEDYKEAVKWFRKAAEQGTAKAQCNLGIRYANGEGVPKNYVEAYKWFLLAAAQGDSSAKENKKIIRKRMSSKQIAEAQRRASAFRVRKASAGLGSK